MRRLSIIDVAGGHQPIHSHTGDEVVICNGKIYNFVGRPSTSAQSAYLFLIFQYVPEPATMFEGVTKLPAGHVLEVAVDDLPAGLPASRAYWDYLAAPPMSGDPAATVRGLPEEATTLTLRSDVPVGIARSSGIDSSLIAVLARRHHAGPLAAFAGPPRA
jgi:asparagine synthase (glutamine-hydrolysing)